MESKFQIHNKFMWVFLDDICVTLSYFERYLAFWILVLSDKRRSENLIFNKISTR